MPAKDKYHDIVVTALEKEEWQITHDPYKLMVGKRRGYIDLGAEKLVAAEKEGRKIAVEIKSFLGASTLDDFEDALGQVIIYKAALLRKEPERVLYLAMPLSAYEDLFDDSFFVGILEQNDVRLIVYNLNQQTIIKWTK